MVADAEHAVASQQDTAGKTAAAPTPAGSGSPTSSSQTPLYISHVLEAKYLHNWPPSHNTVLSTWAVCDSTCMAAEAEHAVASQQDSAGKTAAAPTPAGSGSPTKQPSSPSKGGSGSTFGGLFGSGGSKGGSGSVSSWLPSWGGGKKETEQVTRLKKQPVNGVDGECGYTPTFTGLLSSGGRRILDGNTVIAFHIKSTKNGVC